MTKRKGQNQNKGNITENGLVTILPGMLMSAKLLISEWEKRRCGRVNSWYIRCFCNYECSLR